MATFKVGQRVRIISPDSYTNGKTGKVEAIDVLGYDVCGYYRGYGIVVDGHPWIPDAAKECYQGYVFEGYELEPILGSDSASEYDGNQVISWDACIWNPSHIHKQRTTEETSRV